MIDFIMTQTFEFKQNGHLDPALTDPATRTLHADKIVGHWINTTPQTQGVAEIIIEQDGAHFFGGFTQSEPGGLL